MFVLTVWQGAVRQSDSYTRQEEGVKDQERDVHQISEYQVEVSKICLIYVWCCREESF